MRYSSTLPRQEKSALGSRVSVRKRAGVAAVEVAILLPLLILLLVGIWEVGRMVEVQQLLMNAVREGGRQAATGTKTVTDVKNAVVTYLKVNGITSVQTSDVTVVNLTDGSRPDPSQANQMDQFQISVSIPFNSVRWILLNQITNIKTLSASANWYSMRDIPITVDYSIPLN